jgi:hypothetical protein
LEEWEKFYNIMVVELFDFEVNFGFEVFLRKDNQAVRGFVINTELGGQILGQCVLPEITYHALLVELPANAIQNIIFHQNTALVKSDNIMFFRPSGQVSAGDKPMEGDLEQTSGQIGEVPSGDTVIAVLDGMPITNHQLLANRLIIDDPDSWDASYPVADRSHGTAMASLVIHGDLNSGVGDPLKTPIYWRPIMRPNPTDWRPQRQEAIPEDVLVVDLIHRSVKRIFEGENGQPAVAPTVKIINLSIGDHVGNFHKP